MNIKEAIKMIQDEKLQGYNMNERKDDRENEVVLMRENDKWIVYATAPLPPNGSKYCFALGGIIFWMNGSSFILLPIHGKMGLAIRATALRTDLMEGFFQPTDRCLKSGIDTLQEANRFIDLPSSRGIEISVSVAGDRDTLLPQLVDKFTELSSTQPQCVLQFLTGHSVSTSFA